VFVAGNHDTSIEKGLVAKSDFNDRGIHYLENETIEIEGLKIFGSPYTPTFGYGWSFNKDRNKLERIWRKAIDEDVDIVIVHGPPRGMLDSSYDRAGLMEHCGDKSLFKKYIRTTHCSQISMYAYASMCGGIWLPEGGFVYLRR
jgi:Icc-related predicted phosphoesterase